MVIQRILGGNEYFFIKRFTKVLSQLEPVKQSKNYIMSLIEYQLQRVKKKVFNEF